LRHGVLQVIAQKAEFWSYCSDNGNSLFLLCCLSLPAAADLSV